METFNLLAASTTPLQRIFKEVSGLAKVGLLDAQI